jgi:hypothetical protein
MCYFSPSLNAGERWEFAHDEAAGLHCGARRGGEMTDNTVTRADLCEAVYQKVGLSRTECAALVELVLKEITDCNVAKR